jgi:hypothetical protein
MLEPPVSIGSGVTEIAKTATQELSMLSWVGGLATIAGIVALVITRGTFGMRAIVIGVCLVILNYAIANYLSWILFPTLVGTGCVSLAWAYITIREMLDNKE